MFWNCFCVVSLSVFTQFFFWLSLSFTWQLVDERRVPCNCFRSVTVSVSWSAFDIAPAPSMIICANWRFFFLVIHFFLSKLWHLHVQLHVEWCHLVCLDRLNHVSVLFEVRFCFIKDAKLFNLHGASPFSLELNVITVVAIHCKNKAMLKTWNSKIWSSLGSAQPWSPSSSERPSKQKKAYKNNVIDFHKFHQFM